MISLALLLSFGIALLLSSLPLSLAVKFLGGKSTFWRGIAVGVCAALIPSGAALLFPNAIGLLTFLLITFAYQYFFKLKLWKAFLVWVVQYGILAMLLLIVNAIWPAAL